MAKDMFDGRREVSRQIGGDRLRKRNRALSVLLDIGGALSECRTLCEVLYLASVKVSTLFDFEAVRIYLMDTCRQYLELAASMGVDTSGLERVRLGQGFSGRSAQTGTFIAHPVEELEDKERVRLLASKGFKIIVCVPLITMDKVIGVMNLGAKKMIGLDEEMVDLLSAAGNQIAIGIGNTRLLEDLETKVREIEAQKDKFKLFAYSTLHDLKGPATAAYGLARRLGEMSDQVLVEKGRVYGVQLFKASRHILDLVEKLNTYIATSESPLHLEFIRICDLVADIESEFAPHLSERNVRLIRPGKAHGIRADRLALTRALRNLIENSLKYGGENLSRIKVTCHSDSDHLVISVGDDGVGIPSGGADRLFDPFQRDKTSVGIEGSGLGLAIVREAAQRHDGRVWLAASGRGGATFNISISKKLT